jgi:hypothetical protein
VHYLKLSLVSCPVALFPASSEREKISFNQINNMTSRVLPGSTGALQAIQGSGGVSSILVAPVWRTRSLLPGKGDLRAAEFRINLVQLRPLAGKESWPP